MSTSVLILSTIQGHASIAEAIQQGLQKAHISSVIESDVYPGASIYRLMYRHTPWLGAVPHQLLYLPLMPSAVKGILHAKYKKYVNENIEKYQPQVVISTAFSYIESIEKNAQREQFTFLNPVTDPRTFFLPCLSSGADLNFVFDEFQQHLCKSIDERAKTLPVGWFVRERFEQEYNQNQVRRELRLDENLPTFLLVSGSEGDTKVAKLLPYFLQSRKAIQVIVICGSNKKLYQLISKMISDNPNSNSKFFCISFTKEIHRYMQAADLVIGKAGPNTIFECVATLTPFFATTHIAGQETGNLEIIREYNLGYVEEDISKASIELTRIMENSDELLQFTPALKKMAAYNKQAKEKLVRIVQASLK